LYLKLIAIENDNKADNLCDSIQKWTSVVNTHVCETSSLNILANIG
jgi:hypothetical protein